MTLLQSVSSPLGDSQFTLKPHRFDKTILREYDVRGIVGETLSTQDAFALGAAVGTYIQSNGGQSCAVAYDGRHSSPDMAKALSTGLRTVGINVVNLGIGPTPMMHFAVKDRLYDSGIMVTGSHNPSDFNGFKMTLQNGSIYGETIQEIGRIAELGQYFIASEMGTEESLDITQAYIDRLISDFTWNEQSFGGKDMSIAWDAGNGAAGEILQRLVARLPGTHHLLYADIDGDFPNHHPDPTVDKNLIDLQKAVAEHKCDIGIAFDGDGDRIGAVDADGNILRCDRLMTLYAKEVLKNRPGAPIIGDMKCSQVMFDEITNLGGTPVMWKTGHSLIKSKMAELKAPLAGELSGHIFFADNYYGFDDALYCAIRLLNILGNEDTPLSERVAHLPKTISTPEIRIEAHESIKFEIPHAVLKSMQDKALDDTELIDTDGVRVVTPDGWWLVRASNTQACIVARVESTSNEGMERLCAMLKEQLIAQGLTVPANTFEITA